MERHDRFGVYFILKSMEVGPSFRSSAPRFPVEDPDYRTIGRQFRYHDSVDHGLGEYARGKAHSNTVEGYFSILKRGVYGTFHHVSEAHLHRYLAEFDFRYNNRAALGVDDSERSDELLRGIAGKRLTYRRIGEAAHA